MSKSIGNVIIPDPIIESLGADSLRLYELFIGPFEHTAAWSQEHLAGVHRFLLRAWTLAQDIMTVGNESVGEAEGIFELEVDRMTHKTIKKVHLDIESMSFNTAVSALMEYVNFLATPLTRQRLLQRGALRQRTVRSLLLMLAPLTPHMAEELWSDLGEAGSIHSAAWPRYSEELIRDDIVEIVVQVNGKLRGTIMLPADSTDAQLKLAAADLPAVKKQLKGQDPAKIIVVPRKLVNFVVN